MSTNTEQSTPTFRKGAKINIGKDDAYLYCVPTLSGQISSTEQQGKPKSNKLMLYDAELKIIRRLVTKSYRNVQSEQQQRSIAMIDKSNFLQPSAPIVPVPSEGTKSVNLESKFSAAVICWNGRGSPPDELHFGSASGRHISLGLKDSLVECPYQRIRNEIEAGSGDLCFRWTKVVLFKEKPELADPQIMKKLHQTLRTETKTEKANFEIYHVPFEFQSTNLTLKQALLQVQWATGSNAIDQARWHEILRAFGQVSTNSDETLSNHSKIIFDQLREGNKHHHGMQKQTEFPDSESESSRAEDAGSTIFLGTGSVAQMMRQNQGQSLQLPPSNDIKIAAALRGKLVEIKLDGDKVEKRIESVCPVKCADVADHQKHPLWRGKIRHTLQYPDLPCINVGTKFRWSLLPPEMAKLVPIQPAKALDVSPFEASEMASTQAGEHGGSSRFKVLSPSVKFAKLDLDKMINESCADSVVFIVPGNAIRNHALFKSFQSSVRQLVGDVGDSRIVVFPERPGDDVVSLWKAQLVKLKAAYAKKGIAPKAVVTLGNDERQAFFYKTIKSLCEIDVGLQSYFIKFNTIEQKEARQSGNGAHMTAKILAKKVAMRNPPTAKALQQGELLSLAVAVHIEKIVVKIPMPKVDGSCASGRESSKTLYVVALSSRDVKKSERYKTSVQLVGHAGLQETPLMARVKSFVKDVINVVDQSHLDQVVILRSGYVPDSPRPTGDSGLAQALPEFDGVPDLIDKNKMINNEASRFSKEMEDVVGAKTSVSYMLLSENHDSVLANAIRQKLAQEALAAEKSHRPLFISGNAYDAQAVVHVQMGKSLVNLRMFHDRISDDVVEKRTDSPLAGGRADSPPADRQKKSREANNVKQITPNQLASLWYDQRLDQSKWPVVTHLARLATERARLQIRYDDFHDESDSDLAPCYLKEVHTDVKDSLYFL